MEAPDLLELVLNSTHDAIVAVDADARVRVFNPAAERILGKSAREVLGKHVRDVIPNTRLDKVLATGEAELNQQQNLGDITIVTNRVPMKNDRGEIVGAVAVFRDITEVRKLAEEITNLRQVQSLLAAIIDSTEDAISVVDAQGNGLLINKAYTRITGLTEADVIGKPATVDIAEGESMHMRVLKERQPVRNVPMKVGPMKREVVVNVAPVIVDGELKGSVGVIHDVSEIRRLSEELERMRRLVNRMAAKYTFDDIVAKSPLMRAAVDQARRVAETSVTVLLRGESGTGKELFAHAIHNASPRHSGPFVRVNCAALPDALLESELFGYAEGAFTGARKGGRRGLFEEANGGTLFLDEVGVMNLNLQATLLRVLQEKEITRVGESKPVPVDVRVIGATNISLEQAVAEGRFREDLYYRLNVIPIFIPPLRQRKEDIPELVAHLVRKLNAEYGRSVRGVDDDAMEYLLSYNWPGNVRELENVLGRAMINMRYQEEIMKREHLPPLGNEGTPAGPEGRSFRPGTLKLKDLKEKWEKDAVLEALQRSGYNKVKAASLLGISVRTLYNKMDYYGIPYSPSSCSSATVKARS
ncbi:MAG: sigma-54-dependent transcriptional regulator [Firmicutes bacterium]|nr:sigma-54-dependent transcriptional regulator [Candidatus Fermentithermobacillaceae bacterium]